MNSDEGAISKARELEENLIQQRLSSMTLFELFYGIARSNQSDAEREKVETVLSSKPVHPSRYRSYAEGRSTVGTTRK